MAAARAKSFNGFCQKEKAALPDQRVIGKPGNPGKVGANVMIAEMANRSPLMKLIPAISEAHLVRVFQDLC
jgi:hypothetical protein